MAGPTSHTRDWLRGPVRLAARGAYRAWARQPLDGHSVFFESFQGSGMRGNPAAVFQQMRLDARFRDRQYVWAADTTNYQQMSQGFADDPSVSVVLYGSRNYFKALATTEILVNNVTFPALFSKRPDQFYLNTWHGTPLKRMGKDSLSAAPIENTVANFAMADVLLSTCDYMAKTMYHGAYGVEDDRGQVRQIGYPRIDAQFNALALAEARDSLAAAGMDPAAKRTVLYAPTWRESEIDGAANDAAEILRHLNTLNSAVDARDVRVVARLHPKVTEHAKAVPELARYLVPDSLGTNALLGVTDTLVTDYSSVFFDFLATGTSILFFEPDGSSYRSERGLYLQPDELPGPITGDMAELVSWLDVPPRRGFISQVEARARYCPSEDGSASQRVLDMLPGA